MQSKQCVENQLFANCFTKARYLLTISRFSGNKFLLSIIFKMSNMNTKSSFMPDVYWKNVCFSNSFFCLVLMAIAFNSSIMAQNIRLRSRISPSIINSNSKYADLYGDGNIAVLGSYSDRGVFIFDISNPDAPVLKSWYNPQPARQFLEAVVIGNRGYFGSGNGGGVHIVDLNNPANPVLLGIVNSTNGNGFDSIHEIVVDNGILYENFNSLTTDKRIRIINVRNPQNPVFIRDIVPQDVRWVHAVHIRGNRLFTSGWGAGLTPGKIEIYDISNIETQAPVLLGTVDSGNNTHSNWTSEDGNYLYACRELIDGDLLVFDIRNPAQPLLVKSIKAADLGINAISPHNPVVRGNLLFVSWYQAGVQIFDITNPANPKRIGQYDTYQPEFSRETAEKESLRAEPWDMICGTDQLLNALPSSYDGDWAVFPFLGLDKVLVGDLANGLYIMDASQVASTAANKVADFDGDGKTDLSFYRAGNGLWFGEKSGGGTFGYQFGASTDKTVNGDFDGDGKTDYAVYRPSNGTWYIQQSTAGTKVLQFGVSEDVPVVGDYDSDGKSDIAVFRPSNGTWYLLRSTLGIQIIKWGLSTDKPVVGDYDGDGKSDVGVFRPSNGTWYILSSSSSIPIIRQFGLSADKPVVGDFDGDQKSDIAVYRPSTGVWYIWNSRTSSLTAYQFGLSQDIPVAADYDGDGKADITVFRPNETTWYLLNSSNNAVVIKNYGTNSDLPVASMVNPQ